MNDLKLQKQMLSLLNCAINTNEDEHLCKDPLELSCGHHICTQCRVSNTKTKDIKCSICNEINKRDLDQEHKPQLFNFVLDQNLGLLLNITYEKMKSCFQTYVANKESDIIESHIQFIKDELLIKVESLKIELDKIYESFTRELDEIEKTWKQDYKDIKFDYIDEKAFEIELKKLEDNISKQENLNKENLYYFQTQLQSIRNLQKSFRKEGPQLSFKEIDFKLEKSLIGELIYETKREIDEVLQAKIGKNEFTDLKICDNLYDISMFSNGDILFPNYDKSNLLLYDKKFRLFKTVGLINDKQFRVICLTIDLNDHVYLSDFSNHFVIKTDKNFNELARFGNGCGRAVNQLNKPSGVCCSRESVYVCDKNNKRIQKLDLNLNYQTTFNLEYEPWYIKVINNVAMVRPDDLNNIYFYNLSDFSLIRKYDGHSGLIGSSHKCFYEYYPKTKTFYYYNKNGELLKGIQNQEMKLSTVNNWGSIFILESRLYLIYYNSTLIQI